MGRVEIQPSRWSLPFPTTQPQLSSGVEVFGLGLGVCDERLDSMITAPPTSPSHSLPAPPRACPLPPSRPRSMRSPSDSGSSTSPTSSSMCTLPAPCRTTPTGYSTKSLAGVRSDVGCLLRDVVSWSIMIDGCVKCGEHHEALVLSEMMENAASTAMEEEGGGWGEGEQRHNSQWRLCLDWSLCGVRGWGPRAWEDGPVPEGPLNLRLATSLVDTYAGAGGVLGCARGLWIAPKF